MDKEKRKSYLKKYKQETKRVSITLTNEEYQELLKLSKKARVKPTTYLKNSYLSNKDKTYLLSGDLKAELQSLNFAIRNIANNINQIANHSNIFKAVSNPKAIKEKLQELEELILNFVTKTK